MRLRIASLSHCAFAIGFGAFLLCAETCLHLEDLSAPASWIDVPIRDWIAGASLVASGLLSRTDWSTGRPYQAAAWAFMVSLLFEAFVGHWGDWRARAGGNAWMSEGVFVGSVAGLLIVSTSALLSTLVTRERSPT